MTEWGVFGVIVALVSFVVAVAAPMLKLNGTITRLSTIIEQFSKRLDKLEPKKAKDRKFPLKDELQYMFDEFPQLLQITMKSRKIPPGNLIAVSMIGLTRTMN